MKINTGFKKYICAGFIAACFVVPFFAQAAEDNQIELPDLTTVVTGDSEEEEPAPPPSFDDVLDIPADSGDLVPVLPSVSQGDEADVVTSGSQADKKDIYAEGIIGGGWPVAFRGDFVVSRLYGADPFEISFAHDSAAGFAGHTLSEGYKNSFTSIQLEKDFIRSNIKWGLSGRYEENSSGLQSKPGTENISANVQDAIGLSGNFLWTLPKDFTLGFNLDSQFYFRFADITKSAAPDFSVPQWIKSTSRITADPKMTVGWKYNHIELAFDAAYNLEAWSKACNRGEFDLSFAWDNEKIRAYAQAGIVCGNCIGENKVTVPFMIGLDTSLPVYFSDRKLNLSINGGIKSERKTTWQLENEYKFSVLNELPPEISDWFGQINLLVPLKSSFTGNICAGYLRTAFGNGYYVPDYSIANPQNGLYGYTAINRNSLYTDFSFTWKFKIFAATAQYHANWMDVPVLENKHTVSLDLSLQSQKGVWGASIKTAYLLDAADNKPLINLEGYVQASEAVRIVLSVDDLIKLLGAEERIYAGQYAGYSGNAMLLVKFLF